MTEPISRLSHSVVERLHGHQKALHQATATAWPDPRSWLPAPGHPQRNLALLGLIRADLRARWQAQIPRRLGDYLAEFPELHGDAAGLALLAREEYLQRREAGEKVHPTEYRECFAVDTQDWPVEDSSPTACIIDPARFASRPVRGEALSGSSAAFVDRDLPVSNERTVTGRRRSTTGEAMVAEPRPQFPAVGTRYLDFYLLAELGRGAFGRVYLARQGELADREVVLKVSADLMGEPRTLAQLQHTNIVPIYSVHHARPFHAVCMPYLGAVTLDDLIQHLGSPGHLPASGAAIVESLQQLRTSRLAQTRLATSDQTTLAGPPPSSSGEPASVAALRRPIGRTVEILKRLESASYIEAILWLVARLADGLAHAHERGILHRDLKPANILLTDEGQPLLLDFNLAADARFHNESTTTGMGGTFAYMAPEHLEAFRQSRKLSSEEQLYQALARHSDPEIELGFTAEVTQCSDLYSLGLILYQLLTGTHPFPIEEGPVDAMLRRILRQRLQPLPSMRALNRAISPATESIVRKCLAVHPADRYASARALQEDIKRQLHHLPLRYAPEPSRRERFRKWCRRHPRLSSSTTIACLGLLMLGGAAVSFWATRQRLDHLEATRTFEAFRAAKKEIELLLCVPVNEWHLLEEGLALGRAALGPYGVLEDTDWLQRIAVRELSPSQQEALRIELGDLLLLLAQAHLSRLPTPVHQPAQEALKWHQLACQVYPTGRIPGALQQQRELLCQRCPQVKLPKLTLDSAASKPSARERFLGATLAASRQDYPQAVQWAQEAVDARSDLAPAWYLLGHCYLRLGLEERAIGAFHAAIALQGESPWIYFARGLARVRLGKYDQAETDFSQALARHPNFLEFLLQRAQARLAQRNRSGAMADVNRVLEAYPKQTRGYFLRARIHLQRGDLLAAAQDQQEGLHCTPGDVSSWLARAEARREQDPEAALEDLAAAQRLDPQQRVGRRLEASILAEQLGRTEEAIAVLNRTLHLEPSLAWAWADRGRYHARLGQRDAALRDAAEALKREQTPARLFQVACIYALTSVDQPADRAKAVSYLRDALAQGHGTDQLTAHSDLEPLREHPEFQQLLAAVAVLHPMPMLP